MYIYINRYPAAAQRELSTQTEFVKPGSNHNILYPLLMSLVSLFNKKTKWYKFVHFENKELGKTISLRHPIKTLLYI